MDKYTLIGGLLFILITGCFSLHICGVYIICVGTFFLIMGCYGLYYVKHSFEDMSNSISAVLFGLFICYCGYLLAINNHLKSNT